MSRQALLSPARLHSIKPPTPAHRASTVASRAELEQLLADDVPYGDLTTDALGIGAAAGSMAFTARDTMVLALAEDAAAIIELTGCRVELHAASGTALEQGTPILTAHGPASALLRSWKVAQTLIEIWSGVATEARAIVDAAKAVAPHIAVACTRKNVPGTKRFAVAAVKAGGAVMHRLGLSETVLVFPEHRAFLGEDLLPDMIERLRRAAPEKRMVIEVTVIILHQAARRIARGMIVDVNKCGDALPGLSRSLRGLLHAGAGEIANCLGAVLIAVFDDHSVEFIHQVVVERDGDALQFCLLPFALEYDKLLTTSCSSCQRAILVGQKSGADIGDSYIESANVVQIRRRPWGVLLAGSHVLGGGLCVDIHVRVFRLSGKQPVHHLAAARWMARCIDAQPEWPRSGC